MPNFTSTIVTLSEKKKGRCVPALLKVERVLRARRRRRRAAAVSARIRSGRLDGLLGWSGGSRHGAKPVPSREPEEQQDQHNQRDERRANACACASRVTAGLDDLGAGRAPVPPDAVSPGAEQRREDDHDQDDEQESAQNRENLLLVRIPRTGARTDPRPNW